MAFTIEELKHKNIAELREMAKGLEHEAVQGYTQLNKEHLVIALAKALGIQHTHHDVIGWTKRKSKNEFVNSRLRESPRFPLIITRN